MRRRESNAAHPYDEYLLPREIAHMWAMCLTKRAPHHYIRAHWTVVSSQHHEFFGCGVYRE